MAKSYLREDSAQINTITRRQAITAATAAAIIPTTAVAETIDPHHAWLEEWRVLSRECDRTDRDDAARSINTIMAKLGDLIADTPARTQAGLKVQLLWLREDSENFTNDYISQQHAARIFNGFETFLERLS